MFGLFRKKSASTARSRSSDEAKTASLPNSELLRIALSAFEDQSATVGALFLVAYENMPVYFPSFQKTMEEDKLFSPTIEGMADFHLVEYSKRMGNSEAEEIGRRRFYYFYIAAILKTLQKRAKTDANLWNEIVKVWVALLPGARAIRTTLDKTSLWRDEHIDVFDPIQTEDEGEWHCLRIMVPKEIRYHAKIQDWLERDLTPEQRALIDETCNPFGEERPRT